MSDIDFQAYKLTRFSNWWTTKPQRPERVPSMYQMEIAECGAASLGMILGHLKRFESLEELRLRCGVNRDGSKASNILKAGRSFGLEASGFRINAHEALQGPFPCIVFWRGYHFLVVEGVSENSVWLNDPALGPRRVTRQHFEAAYSGVTLRFSPGPSFQRSGIRPSPPQRIRRWLGKLEGLVIWITLLQLLIAVPVILLPGLSKLFIDDYLIGANDQALHSILIWTGLFFLAIGGLFFAQRYFARLLETKLSLFRSAALFRRILNLPLHFHQQTQKADINHRLGVHDRAAALLSDDIVIGSAHFLTLPIFIGAMLLQSWQLTLINLMTLCTVVVVALILRQKMALQSSRLQRERARHRIIAMAGLQMFETLKANAGEDNFYQRILGQQANLSNAHQPLLLASQNLAIIPNLFLSISAVLTLGIGGWLIIHGQITIGTLIAVQLLVVGMERPVSATANLLARFPELTADLARLDGINAYPQDPLLTRAAASDTASADQLSGRVELRHIKFGYSRVSPPLFNDLNLTVEPGRMVALVGRSGSGKSTIAKLLTGVHEPWEGSVLIDKRPLSDWPRSLIAQSLGLIDQQPFLFEGSIADNLSLWDSSLSTAEITEAARQAGIHDVISRRPGGYNHPMASGGDNFSGGERQQLQIARALLSAPSLLILDEATSALDANTEAEILAAIRASGCACLIISHSPSTISVCDEVLYLDQGEIVARGDHHQLLDSSPGYRQLFAS